MGIKVNHTEVENTQFDDADNAKERFIQVLRDLPKDTPYLLLMGDLASFQMARAAKNLEMLDLLIGLDLHIMESMGLKPGPEGLDELTEIKKLQMLRHSMKGADVEDLLTKIESAIGEMEKEEAKTNGQLH